ncbi:unnamed protein product [Enterobius vermicularis]|uniref:ADP/ATP translocase n=1 Tax=Enterobius vermicularis TaxID=51028 RepID=A0A0N4VCR3_ENTVE|nr:unnamed protein product [Enterobius vermicularis]
MEAKVVSARPKSRTTVTFRDGVKFTKDFAAGATAATIAKTIVAPIERVKLILQLQNAQSTIEVSKRYKGMIDCFLRVPKEQGFWSFWRGNLVNIGRACAQESFGFAFKDFFKIWCVRGMDSKTEHWKFLAGNLAAGGASGVATYCIIYPLDFVRTRLAIDMGRGISREFTGFFDCLIKIAKHDGIGGLYYGFFPSLQYIFLYRSAYYGLFDTAKVFLSGSEKNQISFVLAFFVGQVTTFTAAMISYPHDTVRRRLMMQAGRNDVLYEGFIHCAKKIYIEEGIRGFFSGMLVNAVRGSGAALVLAIYNELAKYM